MSTMSEQNMIQVKGMDPIRNKITEAGTIPEDWVVNSLGKMLITFPSYGINAPAVKLNTSTPVYIRITDISEDGYFRPSEKVGVDSQLSHLYILHEGDLVLARTGASVGKSYLYRPEDGHLVYAGFLIKISPKQSILNSKFLFQYMKTQQYWNWIATNSMRSGQPGVNGKEFGSLPVVVPPLKEQTAIANVLSDTDALIIELEQLIAKKQSIKTATMQQLLTGRTRLPQYAKRPDGTTKNYKFSELGKIPEDWAISTIGDIADVKTGPFGSTLHEKDYVQDGTPIITVEHLGKLGVTYNNLPMVGDKDKARLRSYQLSIGDIVFSRVGSIDRNALIKSAESGWLFSGRLLRIRLLGRNNHAPYVSYHFHTEPFKKRVVEVAVGQTMPSLNTKILKNILILLPNSIEEQKDIATILSDIDAELKALEQKLAKFRDIKQGMMQQLLTGRIRLPLEQQP